MEESMANGSSRLLPGILFLVVGFVAGWLAHRPAAVTAALKVDPLIRVHADGSVSPPEARIDRTNVVAWVADGKASLQILFPESKFPNGVKEPPFEVEGMTHTGTDWAVRCGNDLCFSGNVNPNLPKGRKLPYRYDQVVGGKRTDGMIIINP